INPVWYSIDAFFLLTRGNHPPGCLPPVPSSSAVVMRIAAHFQLSSNRRAINDSQLGWKPLRGRWKSWDEIYKGFAARSPDPTAVQAAKAAEELTNRRFKAARDRGSAASAVACFLCDLETLRQMVSLLDMPQDVLLQLFTKNPIFHDWLVFTDEKWRGINDSQLGWRPLRGRWKSWDEIFKASFAARSLDPIAIQAAIVAEERTNRRFKAAGDRGSAASAVACFLCDLEALGQVASLLGESEEVQISLLASKDIFPMPDTDNTVGRFPLVRLPVQTHVDNGR
ncbi:MAG TPA: hypothetical protein VKT82_14660, partial [Ktedonobacterales bacterium]|nr:hypothetical protein [Ktedonobacterales bacterium]